MNLSLCETFFWVSIAIAAGACVMILINSIETYLIKRNREKAKQNSKLKEDECETLKLDGFRSNRHHKKNNSSVFSKGK